MSTLVKTFSANGSSDPVKVMTAGKHVFAINADAAFGAGTLNLTIQDEQTGEELYVIADEYEFTDVFTAFEVLLVPGMTFVWTLTGATAPSISIFHYDTEGK